MLSTITLIGRPTKDPELMTSKAGVPYVCLDIAVNKGFGDKEHPNYYKAYLKDEAANRVIKAGVKKGSALFITGDLDIRTYTKKDGTIGTSCDVNVMDWGYVSTGKAKTDTPAQQNGGSAGQTEPQPTYNPYPGNVQPQFEEIGDDDDLPF